MSRVLLAMMPVQEPERKRGCEPGDRGGRLTSSLEALDLPEAPS